MHVAFRTTRCVDSRNDDFFALVNEGRSKRNPEKSSRSLLFQRDPPLFSSEWDTNSFKLTPNEKSLDDLLWKDELSFASNNTIRRLDKWRGKAEKGHRGSKDPFGYSRGSLLSNKSSNNNWGHAGGNNNKKKRTHRKSQASTFQFWKPTQDIRGKTVITPYLNKKQTKWGVLWSIPSDSPVSKKSSSTIRQRLGAF